MKNALMLFALLFVVASLGAVNWTGVTSTNWNVGSNWSSGTVPTTTTDLVILSSATRFPIVYTAAAVCGDITIQSGASVTIASTYGLNVYEDLSVYGALNISGAGQLTITGSLYWESGATSSVTYANSRINVYGNMLFNTGSNVQITSGVIQFMGSTANTYIRNYSAATQIYTLWNNKNTGTTFEITATTTQPFTVNGYIYNYAGNTFNNNYAGDIILKGNIIDANTSVSYGIHWATGTLKLQGNDQTIGLQSASCYLNNISCDNYGDVQLTYPLTMKGYLYIGEDAVFDPNDYTIYIGGYWNNDAGTAGFIAGTGRVIFNGTTHQYIYDTTDFNIIEVNKTGGALRVFGGSVVVTCAQYDWTAGALDIQTGTFTANDLADNGLYGDYYVNTGGTLNLTNSDGLVGLGANVYVLGGTMNVYGGTQVSTWPYGADASLTMSGGILNFADTGITISNPGVHSFTYNITGGTIQTSENFSCYNAGFTPTAGTVEMTGTVAAYVDMSSGTLYNLKTDKTIILGYNLTCTGGITVSAGYFRPNSHNVSCAIDMLIYGTLKMNSASDVLTVGDDIAWYSGSGTDITAGSIEVGGFWYMYSGSSVVIPANVTTTLKSTTAETIYIANTGSQFGNLIIGSTSAGAGYTIHASSTQDLNVAGYLTITANNELDLNTRNMTVSGALNLNGKLDIHATTATVHGKPYLETTSNLSIDSGVFSCDESAVLPRTTYLKGTLYINSGTFLLVNNSITVNAGSINTMSAGSEIICDGVTAVNANTFQPAGGTIILTELFTGATMGLNVTAGNWLPNLFINSGAQGYTLLNDLMLIGSFEILTGSLDVTSSNRTITIAGNWEHAGGTFYPRNGRVIFNGSGHQYLIYNETFNIVEANKSGGAIRINDSGTIATIAQYDWTAGSLDAMEGTITINDLADTGLWGGFYADTGGTLNITNTDGRIDLNGTMQITGGDINIYGGTAQCYLAYRANAILTISSGHLRFINQGIYIYNSPTYTLTTNITGGTIYTTGSLNCNRTDFHPTGGCIYFNGGTDATINFSVTGSYFYDLFIYKTATRNQEEDLTPAEGQTRNNTVTLSSNIVIKDRLDLNAGSLNANSRTINIAGPWFNNGGTFTCGTSTVIFDGTAFQMIMYSETFYNLTINKASGNVGTNDPNTITVSNNLLIDSGTLEGYESNVFYLTNLTISSHALFTPDTAFIYVTGNWVDNNWSTLATEGFQPGSSTVYFTGTGSQTVYRYSDKLNFYNLIINKPVGTHCYFYNTVHVRKLAHVVSGIWADGLIVLDHEFENRFRVEPAGEFSPGLASSVNFVGINDIGYLDYRGSTGGLLNVVINKVAGTRQDNSNTPDTTDPQRFNQFTLESNLTLIGEGSLTVNGGVANTSNFIITCPGNININNGGALYVYGTLRIGIDKSLNVNNGGVLNIWGHTPSVPATVTSISGYYLFTVQSGGSFNTLNTIYEKMAASGIQIQNGALFANDHPFTDCTFRNGAAGGTLLTINNSQTITIGNATFPTNTWGGTSNVSKTLSQGSVTMLNTLGDFAGESHENDPYSLIYWTTYGTVDLEVIDAEITSSTPYTGDTVTLTAYIYNGGTLDLTQPVSLDLYKNRSTPPVVGEYGELTAIVNNLPAHTASSVDFVLSNYDVENWSTWLQFDPDEALTESIEDNNTYGPIGIDWRILPAVQNLTITQLSSTQALIDWDYSLPVSGYNIYRSLDPMFTPSPANLIGGVTLSQFQTSIFPPKYFYRVCAKRNEP